ncbi:recombination protein NinB [Xanthomonas albilineans]|uniref:recombination protein NinB n=1 Tax=Xanthomonas albilineans TaxID=29447 RepID=UPI000A4FB95F|nr:recombination protein NinB [Xanthomonas albilineans]
MSYFVLRPDGGARERMAAAWEFARQFLALGKAARVEVKELIPRRSVEQNARLWAMLTDVSQQVEWPVDGKLQRLSPEEWKDIFTAGLTRHQRVAQGVDGGFVMLGARTSRMTVAEMCDLQTLIEAFGAERGVRWSDPHFSESRSAA